MAARSRGQLEAAFTNAIIQFEKEYLGRGPLEARTFFIDDMILIRLRGILTPAEQKLAETNDGMRLVKNSRRQLFETSRPIIYQMVQEILGCEVVSLHTDVSTQTGERIIVLTVNMNLDNKLG